MLHLLLFLFWQWLHCPWFLGTLKIGRGAGSGPFLATHRLPSGPPHGKISRLWWVVGVQWQPGPVPGASLSLDFDCLFLAFSQNCALLAVLLQLRESLLFSDISNPTKSFCAANLIESYTLILNLFGPTKTITFHWLLLLYIRNNISRSWMLTNFDFFRELILTFRPAKPAMLIPYQCSLYDAFFFLLLTLTMSTSTWTALRILWTLIVVLIRNRLTACNLRTRWRHHIVIHLPIWGLGLNWRRTLALCRSWLYPAGTTLIQWNLPHRFRSCPCACIRINHRCLQRRWRLSTSTDTEAFQFRWLWRWWLLWLWLICLTICLTLVLLGARARAGTTLATGVFCC